jgi:tetratricopeptide (TPR) repeat protein
MTDEETPTRIADRLATGLDRLRAGDGDAALAAFADAEHLAATLGDASSRSSALRHQSVVWRQRSEWDRALDLARAAATVAHDAGLLDALAEALNAEATIHQSRGTLDDAVTLLEQALATTTDQRIHAIALANLGSIAAQRGDIALARRHFLESARCFDEADYAFGAAAVLNNFGRAALDLGNARVAVPMLENALGAAQRAGDTELVALVQRNVAEGYASLGDPDRAETLATAALEAFAATHNLVGRAECLRVLAELAEMRGDHDTAMARLTEAQELAEAADARPELDLIRKRFAGAWPPRPAPATPHPE